MRPFLLPLAQRVGRRALWRRGAQSQWVETRYGRMHCYDIAGSGSLPPVVLLHGLATDATPFGPLLMRLRRDARRVLAPDHLGHGFSAGHSGPLTPDSLLESTTQTLDALLHEPAIVVGNSLGGAVAVRYALTSPEKVRALVLVSPAGAHCEDHEWRALKQIFEMSCRADAALFFRRLYQQPPWFLSLFAHELPAAMASVPVRSLLSGASNATALCPDELSALKMPVLLVWGQADRLLPESHLAYFARHLPSGTRIERPEAFGHSPHIDASAALASLIVRFARSLEAAPVSGDAPGDDGVLRSMTNRQS
jgi:pimeloyl-ACP methyl ester carboxylesterase